MEKIRTSWPILVFITGLLISWGVWSFQTGSISRMEFDALETRVAVIESEIKHLPMNDDITQIKTDVATLKQTSRHLLKTVQRLQDYLIRQSKLSP